MRWIVVFRAGESRSAMRDVLEHASAEEVEDSAPIPLEPDELCVVVDGPADLNERLKGQESVVGVYPSSEMTLY